MAKMLIPELGTEITLAEDWTFELFWEHRNTKFWEILTDLNMIDENNFVPTATVNNGYGFTKNKILKKYYEKYFKLIYDNQLRKTVPAQGVYFCYKLTIPKGSILIIDRIYIRKGCEGYSSVTFRTKKLPFKNMKRKPRFWAKLQDVNNIVYDENALSQFLAQKVNDDQGS